MMHVHQLRKKPDNSWSVFIIFLYIYEIGNLIFHWSVIFLINIMFELNCRNSIQILSLEDESVFIFNNQLYTRHTYSPFHVHMPSAYYYYYLLLLYVMRFVITQTVTKAYESSTTVSPKWISFDECYAVGPSEKAPSKNNKGCLTRLERICVLHIHKYYIEKYFFFQNHAHIVRAIIYNILKNVFGWIKRPKYFTLHIMCVKK